MKETGVKLGKNAYTKDKRDLKWKYYANIAALPALPQPPFGHADLVTDWKMFKNDVLGTCVIAGSLHDVMLDNAEVGKSVNFNDTNDALKYYSIICGYDPNAPRNDPSSDPGCNIRNVLGYCKHTGLTDEDGNTHKIDAYVQLDQTQTQEIYESIYFFGKAKIGLQFPDYALEQFKAGQPWTVVEGAPTPTDGHDVEAVGVLANGSLNVVTWGKLQEMTIPFFLKYCDEAWSPLSKEMLNEKGVSLEGFDWPQLETDLADITNIPTPAPVTTLPTHLAVSHVSGQNGKRVKLAADLIDTQNHKPVANKEVSFAISGISVGKAVTNAKGLATLLYTITQEAGTYPISVQFATDDTYESAYGSNNLVVKHRK
jgi:hypothetical protein